MKQEDGILELRLHTDDGPYAHGHAAHNAWSRVWQDVGNDAENQVLILTATGDSWFRGAPDRVQARPIIEEEPDTIFQQTIDSRKHNENNDSNHDNPTNTTDNRPGIHTEFALYCDVTLAAEDADFMDPHILAGVAPGDGQALALQALMGTKRAAYYIYGGKSIPARTALELGIVSDVVPREELLDRAWEIARFIMKRPRFARWATHNILSRPWKKLVAEDFGFHMSQQALAKIGVKELVPIRALIEDAADRKLW